MYRVISGHGTGDTCLAIGGHERVSHHAISQGECAVPTTITASIRSTFGLPDEQARYSIDGFV